MGNTPFTTEMTYKTPGGNTAQAVGKTGLVVMGITRQAQKQPTPPEESKEDPKTMIVQGQGVRRKAR